MKFIENSNEGVHCYNRFSADYSDDIVRINNRDYPLGAVSKMVANISKSEMDEILELGGKAVNCYQTIYLLGYNRNVFLTHKSVILDMLSYMKKLEIFQCFDYDESKKMVDDLLSEESLDQYEDYLKSDKPLTEERVLELKDIKNRYDYAINLGLIYGYIGIDTANFATAVQNFTEFEAAKEYIMDCYERAQTDFDYASEQYEKDMELTAIDEYVRRVTNV